VSTIVAPGEDHRGHGQRARPAAPAASTPSAAMQAAAGTTCTLPPVTPSIGRDSGCQAATATQTSARPQGMLSAPPSGVEAATTMKPASPAVLSARPRSSAPQARPRRPRASAVAAMHRAMSMTSARA
jgi:hypothetical protein